MIPNKLPPLPKKLFNQDWTVTIDREGISEDGEIITAEVSAKCWFNGKAYQTFNTEKQLIRLEGSLIALGDIFPSLENIASGTVQSGFKKYKIYKCNRSLNPDSTVYATILELM